MKFYKAIPIIIILCLLLQGFVPAFAVCEKRCCTQNSQTLKNSNILPEVSVKPHHPYCNAREFGDNNPGLFYQDLWGPEFYLHENSSLIPISLSYFRNNSVRNITFYSSIFSCQCVEGQSDSSSDQKAVFHGIPRVERLQTLFFLPDFSIGVFSRKFHNGFFALSIRPTASGITTPLYLKNLSLLI